MGQRLLPLFAPILAMPRSRTIASLALILVSSISPTALAQSASGTLRGVVRTTEGNPLAGVQLELRPTNRRISTDSIGAFELTGLAARDYIVTLQRTGYASDSATVTIGTDELVLRDFRLSRQTDLPTVAVTEREAVSLDMADLAAHRKEGLGDFITRADLEARPGSRLVDIMRSKTTRLKMVRFCGQVAFASTMGSMVRLQPSDTPRNGGCGAPKECYAQIFVNGIRVYATNWSGLPPNIDQYRPEQIEAIEVYYGGASTPLRFGGTGATCGTIVMWLRRT